MDLEKLKKVWNGKVPVYYYHYQTQQSFEHWRK